MSVVTVMVLNRPVLCLEKC